MKLRMKLSKLGLVVGSIVAFSVSFAIAADLTTAERTTLLHNATLGTELNDHVADTIDDAGAAIGSMTFTVPAEADNSIIVAIQIKDVRAASKAARGGILCYASSDSAGDTPNASFEFMSGLYTSGGADAVGSVMVLGTNMRLVIPTSTGAAEVVFQETSTTNYYLNCILPNGELVTSGIIDFS